ncbi:hypothetical protein GQX73_g7125 [Xylaria multiplex]|uniref:Uncharacterized protein n=1 Tax=Xylaria multiplex TaxID=323545 RepID=A0A7C8INW6_9PEZI|nr:hypothetical protein GQX73_g7125 [Xylaria multiplex]
MAPWGILKWLVNNKKIRKRAIKTMTKYASRVEPIVQTIQAGYETYNMKEVMDDVRNVADDLNNGAIKALDVVNKAKVLAKTFVPSIQVMGKSFADSAAIFTSFNSIATVAGIGANIVLAYQGIKVLQLIDAHLKGMATSLAAQTALMAQENFPQYVYDMISERVTQTSFDTTCSHWFFVYHPDNDWYPGFFRIIQKERIWPEFCGYTNQIDTAFAFMLAARTRIKKRELRAKAKGRTIRSTKLHLLIPAYQPLLILEALKIPEEIGDFVMEGRIHNNKEFVWLNLPQNQWHYIQDIGHFEPPYQGWFDWAMSTIGLAERPPKLGEPRVLGSRQGSISSHEDDADIHNDSDEDKEGAGHHVTPLQHQYKRQHRTNRRNNHNV